MNPFPLRELNGELVPCTGDPGDEHRPVSPSPDARCWQGGKPMPFKATPEMCPACHHVNFVRNPAGMKPTYEELEAAIREYADAHGPVGGWLDQSAWAWTGKELAARVQRTLAADQALKALAGRLAPRTTEEAN